LWFDKLSSHLKSLGLRQSSTSPCIFVSTLIEGGPLIYIGIYVDDIIYFSSSDDVEKAFECCLSDIGDVDFLGKFLIFGGLSLLGKSCLMVILSVSLTQQSFIDSLLDSLNMSFEGLSSYLSPYRSGLHIDSIPCQDMSPSDRDRLRLNTIRWLVA